MPDFQSRKQAKEVLCFLSARDSPLGLSRRSGKIKALPQCQQSPRMVDIPGGTGVLTCFVTEMSTSFSM